MEDYPRNPQNLQVGDSVWFYQRTGFTVMRKFGRLIGIGSTGAFGVVQTTYGEEYTVPLERVWKLCR